MRKALICISDFLTSPVFLEVAPNIFAWYAHLRQGNLTVKVGDAVKAEGAHRQVRKHWPFATGNPGCRRRAVGAAFRYFKTNDRSAEIEINAFTGKPAMTTLHFA